MKIAVCGSMVFAKEMVQIKKELEKMNHVVRLPRNTENYSSKKLDLETRNESTKNKINNDLIRKNFQEVKESDAILILNFDKNNVENYIGGNTFLEMAFAHILDKKIFLLNKIPKMIYSDEIKAIQPFVLNGNLSKIN